MIQKKNSEALIKMTEGIQLISQAIHVSSEAVDTFKKEDVSEEDKRSAIKTMEQSKNSMMMFLKKMQDDQ